jgi:hypothetical protein
MEWHRCESAPLGSGYEAAAAVGLGGANKPKPDDYPSRARMAGKTVLPDFRKRDREYNSFRTRIRDGMKKGPNFAGHLSIIQFGCGTGFSAVGVGDNKTGRPSRFPRGGEVNMYLDLKFRLNSRLLAAQWLDYETDRCVIEFLDFDRQNWKVVSKISVGAAEACYRSIGAHFR